MSEKSENSYGKILKHTSMFGGVQAFQIFVNLVRGKFVALFLGPDGMGVASMFTSASMTVTKFSSLGLNLAFVKETAAASDDRSHLATIGYLSTLLIRFTALLGAIACLVLAPWLSRISFGTTDYAWQFALLGVAVGLNVAGDGRMALLQGLHEVKRISLTSLYGAITGLVAGVPLYYFWGTKGIVPAMVLLSLTTYGFYSYGVHKTIPKERIRFDKKKHLPLIKGMLVMGSILLASALINNCCTYYINIFINNHGNLYDVGLFNSANGITMQYTGVVFTAMALDYFPRLSAAANDRHRMEMVINRQMEIVALIAAPMAILLVATAPLVIRILLTDRFLPVLQLMRWLGISILLKAIAYPLGYIAFAKDNKKLFFWLEAIACNVLYIGLSLIFYEIYGLMGLGYASVIEQGACVILYAIVNFKVYGYLPGRKAIVQILVALLLGLAGFCASMAFEGWISYLLMALVIVASFTYSLTTLRHLVKSSE